MSKKCFQQFESKIFFTIFSHFLLFPKKISEQFRKFSEYCYTSFHKVLFSVYLRVSLSVFQSTRISKTVYLGSRSSYGNIRDRLSTNQISKQLVRLPYYRMAYNNFSYQIKTILTILESSRLYGGKSGWSIYRGTMGRLPSENLGNWLYEILHLFY